MQLEIGSGTEQVLIFALFICEYLSFFYFLTFKKDFIRVPILFTLQTKLGGKINILIERLINLIEGKTNLKESSNDKKDYTTTQPISKPPIHQISQADNLSPQIPGTSSQQLVNNVQSRPMAQSSPNFNSFYSGPTTPLVNAANPTQNMDNAFEPMAANEGMSMFGGSAF